MALGIWPLWAKRRAPLITTDPYPFIENRGQLAEPEGRPLSEVLYEFESPGFRGYVTRWGLTLFFLRLERGRDERPWEQRLPVYLDTVFPRPAKTFWERVDMELVGGCIDRMRVKASFPSSWVRNYYLGHCPQGILGVRGYGEVRVEGVWPGVDWVLRYDERIGGVKQEFVVQAGSRVDQVRLRWYGRRPVEVGGERLRVVTEYGEVVEEGLVGFYGGERVKLEYVVGPVWREGGVYIQEVGYRASGVKEIAERTLVIDPVLQWGTYFGGSGDDFIHDIAIDGNGNLFAAGPTESSAVGFPLQNPGGAAYYNGTRVGSRDGFVARFSGTNLALTWCTFYGGNDFDDINAIEVDGNGNIFITGSTLSTNLPLHNPGGGAFYQNAYGGGYDAFMARFSGTNLSLTWSTYLGTPGNEIAEGLDVDGNGNIFVIVWSNFSGNPVIPPVGGAYVANHAGGDDVYIARFLGSNLNLSWATYFGGSGSDIPSHIHVDAGGNVFITGITNSTSDLPLNNSENYAYYDNSYNGGTYDGFVARFRGTNFSLSWCTYFGGNGYDAPGQIIVVEPGGNMFLGGATQSANGFPLVDPGLGYYYDGTHNGAFDAFIARFSSGTFSLTWSTYIGGAGDDQLLALGAMNNVVGAGLQVSANFLSSPFPLCPGSFVQGINAGPPDGAILFFDGNAAPLWATFYGGPGNEYIGGRDGHIGFYGTYIYAAGGTSGALPASHLPNPGSGAYHDNSYNGGLTDGFILRFDAADCLPLFYYQEPVKSDKDERSLPLWKAHWDGSTLVIQNVQEVGYFSLYDRSGRVIGRWEVGVSGLKVPLEVSSGIYLLQEEATGRFQKVVRLP